SGLSATLTVVAQADDTRVDVTLPAGVDLLAEAGGRIQRQGQVVSFQLQRNEVADLLSRKAEVLPGFLPRGVDLTGVRVEASKPVAVFSGHECTFYPQDQSACDHLEEQLLPTDTWGTRFALVPTILRTRSPEIATEATFWKIVGTEPGTRVRLSRPFAALDPRAPGFEGVPDCADHLVDEHTIELGPRGFCEFGTRGAVLAEADRPVMIMGIVSGQSSTAVLQAFGAHAGDPAIFLVPPESQYRISYTFLAPGTYFNDYVTIVAPAGASVVLDGEAVDLGRVAAPVAGSEFVFAHVPIADGPHRVSADRPFGILVFAFDDYVSYAFTGGLNLNKR
ncbi:MAG: IgGFc-binding protein, partial [bacterium]